MEEAHLVTSPRLVLTFSKRKKQKPDFQDSDMIRSSPFRTSQVHGSKHSEVYGFVGSISTVVATVIFLIWAYVPDKLLESIRIRYYPSRYRALATPAYLMMTLLLGLEFYIGLNFTTTPHPTSLNTLFDEYSLELGEFDPQMEEGDERPIDPISDIDITSFSDVMFSSSDFM
uniref:PIG-P domain-containing protein n=1 Tax=Brassica campestris TaxID=3711 RepID=M4DKP3_BRACM